MQHVLLPKKFSPFKWSYLQINYFFKILHFCNPTVLLMRFLSPFCYFSFWCGGLCSWFFCYSFTFLLHSCCTYICTKTLYILSYFILNSMSISRNNWKPSSMFRADLLSEMCPQLLPLRLCLHHWGNHQVAIHTSLPFRKLYFPPGKLDYVYAPRGNFPLTSPIIDTYTTYFYKVFLHFFEYFFCFTVFLHIFLYSS